MMSYLRSEICWTWVKSKVICLYRQLQEVNILVCAHVYDYNISEIFAALS